MLWAFIGQEIDLPYDVMRVRGKFLPIQTNLSVKFMILWVIPTIQSQHSMKIKGPPAAF